MARPRKSAPRQTTVQEILGIETLARFDPDEDFSDVDGDARNEFALENEDPTRHYHWAHNSSNDIGFYKGGVVPYRVEHFEDGGVFPKMHGDSVKGEAITRRDHVLVSCDKAKWQKRNRYERAENVKTRDLMFKRRSRDLDYRNVGIGSAGAERAEIAKERD